MRECMSRRKRKTTQREAPHPIDVIAGRNLNIARKLAGYTQQRLADEVGLTFQQIQKYETAKNRISLSRAWEFSSILGISFAAFIDGTDDNPEGDQMNGLAFNGWLALYARARATKQLCEITAIATRIVQLCESTGRESS